MGAPPVIPVSAKLEEAAQRDGESPAQLPQAHLIGLSYPHNHAGVLGLEPSDWVVFGRDEGRMLEARRAAWVAAIDIEATRHQQGVGMLGQKHERPEHPLQRRQPLGDRLLFAKALAGEEAYEVMEPVALLPHLILSCRLHQLGVDQMLEQPFSLRQPDVEQAGGYPGREARRLQQPQQAKQPLLLLTTAVIAEGDAGPDLQVPGPELVQPPALVGEPADKHRQAPVGPALEPGPGNPHRQGQEPT